MAATLSGRADRGQGPLLRFHVGSGPAARQPGRGWPKLLPIGAAARVHDPAAEVEHGHSFTQR